MEKRSARDSNLVFHTLLVIVTLAKSTPNTHTHTHTHTELTEICGGAQTPSHSTQSYHTRAYTPDLKPLKKIKRLWLLILSSFKRLQVRLWMLFASQEPVFRGSALIPCVLTSQHGHTFRFSLWRRYWWADPGVLWKKALRAMRAMRGKTLETVPFQPYFGCTKSFLKLLSN